MSDQPKTLLLYLPVPHYRTDAGFWFEQQATLGLLRWAGNFDAVIVYGPAGSGPVPDNYSLLDQKTGAGQRIEVQSLPMVYRPDRFLRELGAGRRLIRDLIQRADYLSFAVGGLFGDWGAVGAYEAHRMGRDYAVWPDRVASEEARQAAAPLTPRQKLRASVYRGPTAFLERFLVRRAALGLFHGVTKYPRYASKARRGVMVQDMRLAHEHLLSSDALAEKTAAAASGPLRIIYAGRAVADKGPDAWLAVVMALLRDGVALDATWLGDGPELPRMRALVAASGLQQSIHLPGFLADGAELTRKLRSANLFLFCHTTPQPARCLIEALASATPLVGFHNDFAAGLIAGHGGGRLVAADDRAALVQTIRDLAKDRDGLAALIRKAGADAAPFAADAVFAHRAEVFKTYLRVPDRTSDAVSLR